MALKLRARLLGLHGASKEEMKEEEEDSQSTSTQEVSEESVGYVHTDHERWWHKKTRKEFSVVIPHI